eukprot:683813-Rhodomonas_salina.2
MPTLLSADGSSSPDPKSIFRRLIEEAHSSGSPVQVQRFAPVENAKSPSFFAALHQQRLGSSTPPGSPSPPLNGINWYPFVSPQSQPFVVPSQPHPAEVQHFLLPARTYRPVQRASPEPLVKKAVSAASSSPVTLQPSETASVSNASSSKPSPAKQPNLPTILSDDEGEAEAASAGLNQESEILVKIESAALNDDLRRLSVVAVEEATLSSLLDSMESMLKDEKLQAKASPRASALEPKKLNFSASDSGNAGQRILTNAVSSEGSRLQENVALPFPERHELQQAVSNLSAERDALVGKLAGLSSERDQLQETVASCVLEGDVMKKTIDSLSAKNEALSTHNKTLLVENESLSADNNTQLAKNNSLSANINTLSAENDSLSADNKSLSEDNNTLSAESKSLSAKNNTLSAEQQALQQELNDVLHDRDAVNTKLTQQVWLTEALEKTTAECVEEGRALKKSLEYPPLLFEED